MMHTKRQHKIAEVEALMILVDKLVNYSWTTCSGFRWRSLVLLNDSTGPDGAQEYAVLKLPPGAVSGSLDDALYALSGGTAVELTQIESLTVSWMEEARLHAILAQLDATGTAEPGSEPVDLGPVELRRHPEGCCHACQ